MKTARINLRKPHSDKQMALITTPGHIVSFCGRRWGKTDGNRDRLFYWMPRDPGLYWWVGLTWRSASMKRAWREVTAVAREILAAMGYDERFYINKSNYEVRIPGLGEIWFRTADNPQSLAGEGVKGMVIDEFSLMRQIVWTEYLQATLLDYGGWASFSGVPKGNNWAASLWRDAISKDGWTQIHATTYDNPYIDPAAVDLIKADPNTPEFFFLQEYMAKILSAEGMVFRFVNEAAILQPLPGPEEGRTYVAGVDVADAHDFTVVSILDAGSRQQVHLDRFHRVGYSVLEDRLAAVWDDWDLKAMIIEDNSIGQPVIDNLYSRGIPVIPFHTGPATKMPLIQGLQSAFEHKRIQILDDHIQTNELLAYESKRTAAGFSYSAPSGGFDDTVMALAFAWAGINEFSRMGGIHV